MARIYVGIACTAHDPGIAIVDERGEVVYAQGTERDRQMKRAWFTSPVSTHEVRRLLAQYAASADEIVVAYPWQLAGELGQPARFFGDPSHLASLDELGALLLGTLSNRALSYLQMRDNCARPPKLRCYNHHRTHATYACYASPHDEAVCAVVDGWGEGSGTGFFHWKDGRLIPVESRVGRPQTGASMGFFYSRLCDACGFDSAGGEEWKVMGLSAYGRLDSRLYALLRPLFRVEDLTLVSACEDEGARWRQVRSLVGESSDPRERADLAHTGQKVFEEVCAELLGNLRQRQLSDQLVLGGGCALNSLWNGKILGATGFHSLFVPSAPADDGNAIGAAWCAFHEDHPGWRPGRVTQSPYLGDQLRQDSLERVVRFSGLKARELEDEELCRNAAELIAAGRIIAWVQGRAEFGPRALGNRSILADARNPGMKQIINARVKFREDFRPLAPSVLEEHAHEYFDDHADSPYMERALPVKRHVRARMPAAVHVDGTARLQTVSAATNPRFHRLIGHFARITGLPVVLNTSFNVMGKPIVHSVEDAVAVFMTSGLDAMVIGNTVFEK